MPHFYDPESGVKILQYSFVTQENKDKCKQEIEAIVDKMMSKWVESGGYENMINSDGNEHLLKLIRYVKMGQK